MTRSVESDVTIEWEVAWFPPDSPDQSRTYTDEERARKVYEAARARGHHPILSRRTVTVSEWVMVAGAVTTGVTPPEECPHGHRSPINCGLCAGVDA